MTVSNQIIEVLDALCERFGIAVDWTQQNVIPYVQELIRKYITYQICIDIISIVGIVFFIGVLLYITMYFHKKALKVSYNVNDYRVDAVTWMAIICWIILGVLCFFKIPSLFDYITNIITCLTFPEKVIFDLLKQLQA